MGPRNCGPDAWAAFLAKVTPAKEADEALGDAGAGGRTVQVGRVPWYTRESGAARASPKTWRTNVAGKPEGLANH